MCYALMISICRRCGYTKIRHQPGGRCEDEHSSDVINYMGPTRYIRACFGCRRRDIAEQERQTRELNFTRDTIKSLVGFLRGEQTHPRSAEMHALHQANLAALHNFGDRLHPLTNTGTEEGSIQFWRVRFEGTSSAPLFEECVRRQQELDANPNRHITHEDRWYEFHAIRDRYLSQTVPRILSFREWVDMTDATRESTIPALTSEEALQRDVDQYHHQYLGHLEGAAQALVQFRRRRIRIEGISRDPTMSQEEHIDLNRSRYYGEDPPFSPDQPDMHDQATTEFETTSNQLASISRGLFRPLFTQNRNLDDVPVILTNNEVERTSSPLNFSSENFDGEHDRLGRYDWRDEFASRELLEIAILHYADMMLTYDPDESEPEIERF